MLIVEWRPEDASGQHRRQQEALLLASICASNIVAKCSDLPVSSDGIEISTLNVHCGLGFGKVVGLSVGDTEGREYLVIGDCVRQVTDAINAASQGEVVASPEALSVLRDLVLFDDSIDLSVSTAQVIAHKGKRKFRGNQRRLSTVLPHQEGYAGIYESWSLHELELLRRKMAPYVHPVVAEREFSVDAGLNVAGNQSMTAELREVFTVFIQPRIQEDLTGKDSSDIRVHELLNNIMLLVKKEISFFKGQLRQCVFDDKGLVIMVNLGLRGSTFPNLIKERGVPFVEKVQMLLKSELNLETAIGASYGKAYCGIVGCEERGEYAILGPAVNLAARLMGHPMNPGVLVDLAVKQKAGGLPFKPLPPVAAKGYDKPVKIFKPLYSDQEESKDTNTQFIGRKSELQHLQASAERVYTGCKRSNFTLISAPCGIGKTLLLRKATKEMEAWCHSQGLSYHISEHIFFHDDSFKPFSVVRPLFLDLLRRKQEASKGMHQVIGHTSSLGLSHEIEEAQLYVTLLQICLQNQVPMPYIEMFGGLLFTDKLSEIGKWSDRSRKKSEWSKAAKYFVKVYVSYTYHFDLVLLALDDISGMDEMSWHIIQRLYRDARNLMIIGTARTELGLNASPKFWEQLTGEDAKLGKFEHMTLPPLEEREVCTNTGRRLSMRTEKSQRRIAQVVYHQSQGNPLLAGEILATLYEDESDGAHPHEVGCLEELLLNRLDSLSPSVRSNLSLCAILGRDFKLSRVVDVIAIYNKLTSDQIFEHAELVAESLKEAVDCGIIYIKNRKAMKYSFSHIFWKETLSNNCLVEWKEDIQSIIAANAGAPAPVSPLGLRSTEVEC